MSELEFADSPADSKAYLPAAPASASAIGVAVRPDAQGDLEAEVDGIVKYVAAKGYTFEPWQIAAYVTAVRTKPFVILAGISGTGKTRLPQLVAKATNAECLVVPVRPDWTDSTDLIGYVQLGGEFVAGSLLHMAKRAEQAPERQFFFVLDEMNIARVEYYLAEVLSRMEDRIEQSGRFVTPALAPDAPTEWRDVRLPDNLCIVGSVNMDETTFGFSRKVLDRAFVIEFSDVDLSALQQPEPDVNAVGTWPSSKWRPAALQLVFHPRHSEARVGQVIENLTKINEALQLAQLQVGYRVRDEVAMFCLAAEECSNQFVTAGQGPVDPLDVALAMKVLPRIQGSEGSISRVLSELQRWASPTDTGGGDQPGTGSTTQFPFCADRIALMMQRLKDSGFANYWL